VLVLLAFQLKKEKEEEQDVPVGYWHEEYGCIVLCRSVTRINGCKKFFPIHFFATHAVLHFGESKALSHSNVQKGNYW
jgi:hypothetical protein